MYDILIYVFLYFLIGFILFLIHLGKNLSGKVRQESFIEKIFIIPYVLFIKYKDKKNDIKVLYKK